MPPSWQAGSIFTPDQLTVASEQLFSHTISVVSATNHTPICTVTSRFNITSKASDKTRSELTNDNELQCYTTTAEAVIFNNNLAEYSFDIMVRD